VPILGSALPFALAHYGYGPDPIAIFFLALILGYVYQRTHRILPCMIAHALFNSVAVFVLWRMVFGGADS
jgi:membrane protease YdiL (CAAX protease family)